MMYSDEKYNLEIRWWNCGVLTTARNCMSGLPLCSLYHNVHCTFSLQFTHDLHSNKLMDSILGR